MATVHVRGREQVRADPTRCLAAFGDAECNDAVERGSSDARDHAASDTRRAGRKPSRSYFGRIRSIVARSIRDTMRSSPGP